MYVKQIYTGCLSEAAYFIESNGIAAVVDPLRDIEVYLDLAAERKATIKYIFETLSIKTAERNIKCSIKKGCEQPVYVFADKEKMSRVLINLIENAFKYGKQGGNIIASVYKTDEKHVLVEISDDGIGIAEEHLHRIFERFYRTDLGRSRNIGGTGLGLAICKHIIEAHSQTIHVRSTVDVGTTVGFTLEAKKD